MTQGSSPLARGLRRLRSVAGVVDRIIPARAGFTALIVAACASGADHPRSRGVYNHERRPGERCEGSSPLARGLLVRLFPVPSAERIIPARAGFTTTLILVTLSIMDHPRSRGVYCGRA